MDKKVTAILRKFKKALAQKGIRVKKMIVFGSYATGSATPHSDIDVVVISDDFKGKNILQRLEVFGEVLAKAKIMEPIEPLGYTTKEFMSKGRGTLIGDEVKPTGVTINL